MESPSQSPETVTEVPKFETITDVQDWISRNWVHPAGSREMQVHARGKLDEEVEELKVALQSEDDKEITTELGDVLWTALVNGANAGIRLDNHYWNPEDRSAPVPLSEIEAFAFDGDFAEMGEAQLLYNLTLYAQYLGKTASFTRALNPQVDLSSQPNNFTEAMILVRARQAFSALDKVAMICSIVARRRLDMSLGQIFEANYKKLTGRIEEGLPVTKPVA